MIRLVSVLCFYLLQFVQSCVICSDSTIHLAGVVDTISSQTWGTSLNANFRAAITNTAYFGPTGLSGPRRVSLQSFSFSSGSTPISMINQTDILWFGTTVDYSGLPYFTVSQRTAVQSWFNNGGSIVAFMDSTMFNPFWNANLFGYAVSAASCANACVFNTTPSDFRYGSQGPFGKVKFVETRLSVGIMVECILVNQGGFVTSRDPSSRLTSVYWKPGTYRDAQNVLYPNSGAMWISMDSDIYNGRTYQPLSAMEPQPKFVLNVLNAMFKDIFNENLALPGCWPDSHLGFMSVTSTPNALNLCTSTSLNTFQYVRLLRDSTADSASGMNLQTVIRNEGGAQVRRQVVIVACSRAGGCDLAMQWSSHVCNTGILNLTINFATGVPPISLSCVGNTDCDAMFDANFDTLKAGVGVQSIYVNTSTGAPNCFGCTVELRITPPEHPCLQSINVANANLTAGGAASMRLGYFADIVMRFSLPVSLTSTGPELRLPVIFGNSTFNASYWSGNLSQVLVFRVEFNEFVYGQGAIAFDTSQLNATLRLFRSPTDSMMAVPQMAFPLIAVCSSCAFHCSYTNSCVILNPVASLSNLTNSSNSSSSFVASNSSSNSSAFIISNSSISNVSSVVNSSTSNFSFTSNSSISNASSVSNSPAPNSSFISNSSFSNSSFVSNSSSSNSSFSNSSQGIQNNTLPNPNPNGNSSSNSSTSLSSELSPYPPPQLLSEDSMNAIITVIAFVAVILTGFFGWRRFVQYPVVIGVTVTTSSAPSLPSTIDQLNSISTSYSPPSCSFSIPILRASLSKSQVDSFCSRFQNDSALQTTAGSVFVVDVMTVDAHGQYHPLDSYWHPDSLVARLCGCFSSTDPDKSPFASIGLRAPHQASKHVIRAVMRAFIQHEGKHAGIVTATLTSVENATQNRSAFAVPVTPGMSSMLLVPHEQVQQVLARPDVAAAGPCLIVSLNSNLMMVNTASTPSDASSTLAGNTNQQVAISGVNPILYEPGSESLASAEPQVPSVCVTITQTPTSH